MKCFFLSPPTTTFAPNTGTMIDRAENVAATILSSVSRKPINICGKKILKNQNCGSTKKQHYVTVLIETRFSVIGRKGREKRKSILVYNETPPYDGLITRMTPPNCFDFLPICCYTYPCKLVGTI